MVVIDDIGQQWSHTPDAILTNQLSLLDIKVTSNIKFLDPAWHRNVVGDIRYMELYNHLIFIILSAIGGMNY